MLGALAVYMSLFLGIAYIIMCGDPTEYGAWFA